MKRLLVFTIIPLVLSIGIMPALPYSDLIQDAEALKAQGKPIWRYGSATAGIVCGDRLCSESHQEEQTTDPIIPEIQQHEESTEEEMKMTESFTVDNFVGNLYLFTEGGYNSVFIPTGEGVIVFDAPVPNLSAKATLSAYGVEA